MTVNNLFILCMVLYLLVFCLFIVVSWFASDMTRFDNRLKALEKLKRYKTQNVDKEPEQ